MSVPLSWFADVEVGAMFRFGYSRDRARWATWRKVDAAHALYLRRRDQAPTGQPVLFFPEQSVERVTREAVA